MYLVYDVHYFDLLRAGLLYKYQARWRAMSSDSASQIWPTGRKLPTPDLVGLIMPCFSIVYICFSTFSWKQAGIGYGLLGLEVDCNLIW